MTKLELLEQQAYDQGICIYYYNISCFKACIIKLNNEVGIFIDDATTSLERPFLLGHELSHFYTSSYIELGKSYNKRIETKAHNYYCTHFINLENIIDLIKLELEPWQIAEALDLCEDELNTIFDYIKRKNLLK